MASVYALIIELSTHRPFLVVKHVSFSNWNLAKMEKCNRMVVVVIFIMVSHMYNYIPGRVGRDGTKNLHTPRGFVLIPLEAGDTINVVGRQLDVLY